MDDPAYPDALPTQYRLHWYVLERVLGQGGFGITYLARDTNLDQPVAIKEYLPIDVATRKADSTVRSRTGEQQERYRWGLDRFIQEARTLARFDHPNIVRALSVFEHNNTAYMVMRFEEGENLAALLERRRTLLEKEIKAVLLPILSGLELVHGAGFIHRDIKPENIHIRSDGSPVLLDFGSARGALGQSRTVTILVAPGYAPFEQYYSRGENQGPWTDIYGLGATCYRAVTGVAPMDAITRSKGVLGSTREILQPASQLGAGRYSAAFLHAVDHALAFAEQDRPQSIAAWREELSGGTTQERASAPTSTAPAPQPGAARSPVLWAAIGALVAFGAAALWFPARNDQQRLATLEAQLAQLKRDAGATQAPASPVAAPVAQPTAAPAAPAAVTTPAAEPPPQPVAPPAPAPRPAAQVTAAVTDAAKPKAVEPRPALKSTSAPARAPVVPEPEHRRAASAPREEPTPAPAPPPPLAMSAPAMAPNPPAAAPVEPAPAQPSAAPKPADSGPPEDDKAAFAYYRKRADGGDAEAQFRLGEMYAAGRGVPLNNNQAYIWLSLAARAGHAGARARQGQIAARLQRAEVRQAEDFIDKKSRSGS